MGDLYSECIVKRKTPIYTIAIKLFLLIATFIALTFMVLMLSVIPFIIAVAFGIVYYFYATGVDLEFEYTFVNGELDVDKIMNKSRRRRILAFDFSHLEIMARENSHLLDSYRQKNCKTYDFTSLKAENKDKVYVIYGTDKNEMIRILFEPDEKMLNDMRNNAPRKVNIDKF